MTGDHALQCIELAFLRERDRQKGMFPRDDNLINALDFIAAHLAEFQWAQRAKENQE